MTVPTTAPSLSAAGGTVWWLLQRHALKLHHEIGNRRQHAGRGWGGAWGHLVSIVSPISGGGAHPVFTDYTRRQEAVFAAAQQVLLGSSLDQVGPVVAERDVELAATHSSFQDVLGCSTGGDAGECCVLPVLHLLKADIVTLVQEGTNRNRVAELFGLPCNQRRMSNKKL